MSESISEPVAPIAGTGRIRPKPSELLTIAAVVVVTVIGVVLVFRVVGPDVRPASTPAGWSGVYGNRFALALPNDFGITTDPANLQDADVAGAQMIAGKDGSDPNNTDAAVVIVSSDGTDADAFSSFLIGDQNGASHTTINAGDAITTDVSSEGVSGRVWVVERDNMTWGVIVLVREAGPYSLDDLGTKIANSFDAT
jgi:hypothetical protein